MNVREEMGTERAPGGPELLRRYSAAGVVPLEAGKIRFGGVGDRDVYNIATRAQFPEGPAKRPDLVDVIFAGGLVRHWDGSATLVTGLSDAEAGYLRIPDPMAALENS